MKTAYLVNKQQDDEKIVILNSESFETVNLCECYDRYGQKIGCYNAECYSEDNSSCDFTEGEEENHTQVEAFNYWNGSNWQSLFLNSDDISTNCIEEMDEAESKRIIAAFNRANLQDIGFGRSEYVGRKYKFTQTQFASDPYIATVETI